MAACRDDMDWVKTYMIMNTCSDALVEDIKSFGMSPEYTLCSGGHKRGRGQPAISMLQLQTTELETSD